MKELELALRLLSAGQDEAKVVGAVRSKFRTTKKAAEFLVLSAREQLAASEAPKALVRKQRLAKMASAVEEEGARVVGLRAAAMDRGLAQQVAAGSSFLAEFEALAARHLRNKIVVPASLARKKSSIKRTVNLALSDLHFGADLQASEVPLPYGSVQESRRLASVMAQTADYKTQYRDDSSLNVHVLGDVIDGSIGHDPRAGKPLAWQVMAATSLLSAGIAFQAAQWRRVDVYWQSGNHDRRADRHQKRAVVQKWDSMATIIGHSVRMILAHLPNVRVHLFQTPYYVWESYGEYGFGTHSDTVLHTGQPSKKIDTASIENQIHEMNDAFRNEGKPPCKLWVHGHTHRAYTMTLETGEVVIGNGPLVPSDPYAVSLGKLTSSCSQSLWESVPGHIFGDYRQLRVGKKQDEDSTLDRIVRPFGGFDG